MTRYPQMKLDRYLQLLEAYGADLKRWPPEDRPGAERLFEASEQARRAHREARALDGLLDQVLSAEPSDILKARIHRIPELAHRPGVRTASSSLRRIFAPMVGLAAAALLGIAVGSFAYEPPVGQQSVGTAEMTSEDWDELTELAFASNLDSEELP
jgi:hypothetical protein